MLLDDVQFFLDAPFWEKLYYLCLLAGIALLFYVMMDFLPRAGANLRSWLKTYRREGWPQVKAETLQVLKRKKKMGKDEAFGASASSDEAPSLKPS